jgi:ATP-dependent RNA helicase DHX8/PRP22
MAPSPKDAGLKKLEFLSLVSKVYMELETHLGFGDKILAEFITDLGRNGAEMLDY